QYDAERKVKDMVIPAGSEKAVRSREEFPAAPVTTHKAEEAFALILAHAGASRPRRDPVDVRVIASVRTGQTTTSTPIIEIPPDGGGYREYRADKAPVATDGDGMPDEWEKRYGLAPNNPADAAQDADGDGYTNLEEYLNNTDPRKFVDYTKPENNKSSW